MRVNNRLVSRIAAGVSVLLSISAVPYVMMNKSQDWVAFDNLMFSSAALLSVAFLFVFRQRNFEWKDLPEKAPALRAMKVLGLILCALLIFVAISGVGSSHPN